MDANRFDMLSRSLSRRGSRRGLAAGGLAAGLAALGFERAAAARTCSLQIKATTATGPNQGTVYTGELTIEIGDDGAIDNGSFDTSDGDRHPLVGQATGRALHLRITLGNGQVVALEGTAANDLILCRGDASGTFGGPDDTDLGTWRTVDGDSGDSGSSGSSATSSGGGGNTSTVNSGSSNSSGGGNSGGGNNGGGGGNDSGGGNDGGGDSGGDSGGDDGDGGGNEGGGCPSGVVCGDVCCAPAPGLSADNIVCNAGFCECAYSCASAGCGGGDGFIVNTCGSDPEPHCHSECNVPDDNGCGDMTCTEDETLDLASCTCFPNDIGGGGDGGGGGAVGCVHPFVDCGIEGVLILCADTQNDPQNCGGCGGVCMSMRCIEGGCIAVIN